MSWLVAIPTYRRVETLRKRTLATLLRGGIDPKRIYIFVADEEEADAYHHGLERGTYSAIVVGVRGLGAQRNFITDHFPDGQPLLQVDDDVHGVYRKLDDKRAEEVTDLNRLADGAFDLAARIGARLWGLYPLFNPFYMGEHTTIDLRPIIGTLWGNLNDRSFRLACAVKSDIERTLQHYEADGMVLRLNDLAPKQNARTEPGGHQTEAGTRTHDLSQQAADYLVARWPHLVTHAKPRAGQHAEVRLKDRRLSKQALADAAQIGRTLRLAP